MKLNNINLDTSNLEAVHFFYVRLLGLPVLSHSNTHLSMLMGNTRLTFQEMAKAITPRHVTIIMLRDSLVVLMNQYDDLHHLVAQTPQQKSNRQLKPQPGRPHFYDPMGNLIELIPQAHLAVEQTIFDLGVAGHMEQRPVLKYA